MKIIWQQNPLRTYVELEKNDYKKLFLRNYRNNLSYGYTKEESMEWAIHQHPYLVEALTTTEQHCGDCIKFPTSCTKCLAEGLMGIDPTKELSALNYINRAFSSIKEENLNLAIEYLENYEVKADWDGWEKHKDRWTADKEAAKESLIKYREKHFPNQKIKANEH